MKKLAVLLCALFLIGCDIAPLFAQDAQAPVATQTKPFDKRRLLVQPRNADGSIVVPPFMDDPVLWLRDEQQNFYNAMSKALKAMGAEGTWAGALSLMVLSLGYGVFHAAGPGHGKAVVSGWLLATENQLRRGILVAFLSAMTQSAVAVILVSGLLLLVSGAAAAAKDMAGWLQSASFIMIAAMGGYLTWTGLRSLSFARPAPVPVPAGAHHFEIVNPLPAAHSHDHDHSHVHGPECGHVHAPTAADVAGDWSWKRAASLSLAVGLRPCSGAILVLLFAQSAGIYWAGVISTFIMGLGTFAMVSLVAILAVYSKKGAERLFGRDDRWLQWLNIALRIGGGLMIVVLGILLFLASFQGMTDTGF